MNALYADLLGDAEIAVLLAPEAEIAAMVAVERAMARAGARVGVLPADAAAAIDRELEGITVPPEALTAGTAAAGVPVPALVAFIRGRLPPEAAHWLHWGATSQDVMDGALVLRLLAVLDVIEARRARLSARLAALAESHARLPMAGRTRSQIAVPISFGLRVAQWLHPLLDSRDRLPGLRMRLGRVQFGGAAGSASAVTPHGPALAAALAAELGLSAAPPWHTNRAAIGELGGWCADLAAALGKMAGDLILMTRRESAEVRLAGGGGSSTMPQKANPVAAETAVALARWAATLATPLHLAGLHHEERDGTAWMLEWLALPPLLEATGAALRHATTLMEGLEPDATAMAAALAQDGGAAMAEAASFALADRMPRAQAQALVADAVALAHRDGHSLASVLGEIGPTGLDWDSALDPAVAVEAGLPVIRAILARMDTPPTP